MQYRPKITKKAMIFDFYKPIYGSFYAIWDKWLKIAKARDLILVINVPEGIVTMRVEEYLRKAKKLKRFYKDPDEPMIFYGLDMLPEIKEREERKKLEKKVKESKGEILFSVLEKLKKNKPELFEKIKRRVNNY